jgi:protein-L-isoaspartate(D-aspartate) O-methyltransferase
MARWKIALLICVSAVAVFAAASWRSEDTMTESDKDTFFYQRQQMVRTQLVTRDIIDVNVLEAMSSVPRHEFVPEEYRSESYTDGPLPIGYGQTISQPYIVAIMTQLMQIDSTSKVLEIGTGSGYQAAILAEIAKEVYTIEIVEPLCERADSVLSTLGYDSVHVRCGDGYRGWPEAAPFDAIIVTAAPDHVPQPLIDQLKDDGIMVIPVGDRYQELIQITKTEKGLSRKSVIPVRFVPMTGEAED